MVVAGYRLEAFGTGQDYQISEAMLRPIRATEKEKYLHETGNEWQERVVMKPGEYRARIVSWGSFNVEKKNPASGWVKFKLK